MQKKNLLKSLITKFSFGEIGESREIGESKKKIKQQFLEISRLGNNPIVMQMGN